MFETGSFFGTFIIHENIENDCLYSRALSYYKIWKSRRSKCEEIMNAILDAYDKPKKVLKEAAEIEDDPQVPPKIPFT